MIRGLFILLVLVFVSGAASAADVSSKSGRVEVEEDVLKVLRQSSGPADMLARLATRLLPGDDYFLQEKLQASPDLRDLKKMPEFQLDHGVFVMTYQKLETSMRLVDDEKWDFEINHQHAVLRPGSLPMERWLRLTDAMAQAHAGSFAFLPVAFALETASTSMSSFVAMAITSAVAHGHATALNVKVRTGNGVASYTEVWKKAIESKTSCTNTLLSQMAQKMAELQVSEVRCEELPNKTGKGFHLTGRTVFQLPFGDTGIRTVLLDSDKVLAHEQAPDLGGGELVYSRSTKADLPFTTMADKGKESDKKEKEKVRRQKGMAWVRAGSQDPGLRERAEQLRELLNEAYVDQLCERCGLIFHTTVGQIGSPETESTDATPQVPMAPPAGETAPATNMNGLPPLPPQ